MSDLIERTAVLDLMRTNWADNDGDTAMQLSIDDVRNLPASEPQRPTPLFMIKSDGSIEPIQKTGKWKIKYFPPIGGTGAGVEIHTCSCCGEVPYGYEVPELTPYCPNCGAKMEGESE